MDLKDYKKAKDKFMKGAQGALAKEFKVFFTKHPEIDGVRWTQYTPHFNDGDVCEFGRHEFGAKVTVLEKSKKELGTAELISAAETDEDGYYEGWDIDGKTPLGKAVSELDDTFSGVDDAFKAAFGDGVKVTATRTGFTVEDFDHD